ncbi:hypothetical protein PS850_05227 [Pseudomonas fluorescens]|nr:hypothetical protein PS850_05227 [Pseudomonas fluorescens]
MLVTIQIQDDLLSTLLTQAQEVGSSVESFIEETLREALDQPVAENTLVEGLLILAIQGVAKIKAKAEFSLDDVLGEGDWNLMTGGERKSLGRRFRKEAEGSGIAKWLRRNSGNKAIYQKL